MPKVKFEGSEYEVEGGERLRDALRRHGVSPHNGRSEWFNCKGFGTCGTCAVQVHVGDAGPMNARERWRLGFPPHERVEGMRLACQVHVHEDLEIEKHPGFWGHELGASLHQQGTDCDPEHSEGEATPSTRTRNTR